MIVSLRTSSPCPECGCRVRVFMTATVRVNKRSLRTTGVTIGFIEHTHCPECGTEIRRPGRDGIDRGEYRLSDEDAVRVAEYRKRRWGIETSGEAVERVAG